ncbi:unnamed protein product [Nesidiocoris tenuis]|uniref:Uncharacterized protein n=1 Tax=Nesidiocoris tenuis TaxID=355587 RepID=A0A6H5H7J3_9HEMI|nr:unnamed protein product [Nesidiocoris tenuis]CAB0013708.1 unnamed protein product [Nesidiocoris tenuis]
MKRIARESVFWQKHQKIYNTFEPRYSTQKCASSGSGHAHDPSTHQPVIECKLTSCSPVTAACTRCRS